MGQNTLSLRDWAQLKPSVTLGLGGVRPIGRIYVLLKKKKKKTPS